MNHRIIAECNLIEEDLTKLYCGRIEFTTMLWYDLRKRLAAIRKEARKEKENETK